jgi:DNA-directed RNA polymerase subunit RPC12/RpoP
MNFDEKVEAMMEKVWEEWRCIECGRVERDPTALMEKDEEGQLWRCIECGRVAKEAKKLTEKIAEVWKCIQCGKLAEDSKAKWRLRRHVETHMMDVTHACSVCGHTSTTSSALSKHVAKKHPEMKVFVRTTKPKSAKKPKAADAFMGPRVETTNEEAEEKVDSLMEQVSRTVWKCSLCGKKADGSKEKWRLRRHIETHLVGVTHYCSVCEHSSSTTSALNKHVTKKHPELKLYIRSMKNQSPTRRTSSGPSVPRVETSIEEADEKAEALIARIGETLYCGECGKAMPKEKKWQMRRHVEVHLEGMSFPCDICGKHSKSTHGLYQHKSKQHPELKIINDLTAAYKCNVCGKGSKTSKGLSNHKWKYHRGMEAKLNGIQTNDSMSDMLATE